jgi:hypothetical protein
MEDILIAIIEILGDCVNSWQSAVFVLSIIAVISFICYLII